VLTAVAGSAVLVAAGLIGSPQRDERFESKQVVVTPAGGDGLRIREVVDVDFGTEERRGYQRLIPNDFGAPVEVVASSPDAPDDVSVVPEGNFTRVRVGDPAVTNTGQHRYVLTYTLPEAQVSAGELALDIIDTRETLATEQFEIVVAGLDLEDPLCNVGSFGQSGGCDLLLTPDGTYRAQIEHLEPGQGITIGGRITGVRTPPVVAAPPLPRRISDNRIPLAVAMVPLGLASGGAVYLWSRRRGRNEVFAGGAADAAYGPASVSPVAPGSPLPPPQAPLERSTDQVRLVADDDLADLATIEFVPPKGVDPWQGAVLLRERIDDESVGAWFSGLAARDVLAIERDGEDTAVLRRGAQLERARPEESAVLSELFADGEEIPLGRYDKDFAKAWNRVRADQERSIAASGFWKRDAPRATRTRFSWTVLVVLFIWVIIGAGSILSAVFGVFSSPLGAIVFGIIVPGIVALVAYRTLLPVRSATGSALALRTESFRRFLAASEGRHVEWAWKQGLLREYSAWAVALGAATAWERALAASSVPSVEYASGPLLVYTMGPSFASGHTAPSSSGGSGGGFSGGGFSGGSVGGGGGGGSSGSW
jgi:uncharacterized membrane protein YgcG